MEKIKTPDLINEFIKNQLLFLMERFKSVEGVSISIGTDEKHFDKTNFKELLNFSWDGVLEDTNTMEEKLDKYTKIKNGNKNIYSRHSAGKEEPSRYKSYGTIYMIHSEMFFELQFIQEFKSGMIPFKEFTYTSGKLKHLFPFVEITPGWIDGPKNMGFSFKEALSDIDGFVEKRCA